MAKRANVLIVDDRPDAEARGYERRLRQRKLNASAQFPADVEATDLSAADLILVDFDLEHWTKTAPIDLELARQPSDGVALASVLRRNARQLDPRNSPTAVALITQKIASVTSPMPPTNRAHIAASLNGLEWIFDKSESRLLEKIEELASATLELPTSWGDSDLSKLAKLLGIDDKNKKLEEEMLEDVLRCVPPIHEIRDWEQGIAIIRWLLHRVLPYPCCLIDVNYLAARFSVAPADFRKALESEKALSRALAPFQYKGILSSFLDTRWWRVGIEAFLWQKTGEKSFDPLEVTASLNKFTKKSKLVSQGDGKVVVVNEDFVCEDALIAQGEAVRIWPDDWPSFALQPWASVALAKQSKQISALVMESDRHRL